MGSDTLAVAKEFVSINEKTLRRSLTKLVKWHKINEAEYIKYQTMKDNVRLKHICDKVAKQLGESETKLNVILNDILPVTAYPIFFNIIGESVNMNAVLTLLLHESRSISFVVTELLHGIIDPEEMAESESSFRLFMNEFWRQNGLERVGRNIMRMSSCIDKSQYTGLAHLEKSIHALNILFFCSKTFLKLRHQKQATCSQLYQSFCFGF